MEKIILKESVNPDKKRLNKPKKRVIKEVKTTEGDDINDMVMRAGEVYQKVIKKQKQVGSYKIGKSFHVFFEKKPNLIHRFLSRVLLGWEWQDQK
jgi:hypothetical protein